MKQTQQKMKITNLLISTLLALWVSIIAVFSVQNFTPVSLQVSLLGLVKLESFALPVGIMLTFCFGIGAIIGALVPMFWQGRGKSSKKPRKRKKYQRKRESYQNTPDPLEDW